MDVGENSELWRGRDATEARGFAGVTKLSQFDKYFNVMHLDATKATENFQ